MEAILFNLEKKMKDVFDNVRVEQKIAFETDFFDLYFPRMALESQIYDFN